MTIEERYMNQMKRENRYNYGSSDIMDNYIKSREKIREQYINQWLQGELETAAAASIEEFIQECFKL